ncbi:helix-turn-helix domain-containing protein [Priestia megaterium]|uniref:helix-turn-helix domain-containing protein n=1 Tax=Priestia megaterium TaxID=1404 RepID=UPI0012BA2858|nr:helix-turn-helix domain-containing protein [Priestia megaterium]
MTKKILEAEELDLTYLGAIQSVEYEIYEKERRIILTPNFSRYVKRVFNTKVFQKFLMLSKDFFSVNDVAEILKVKLFTVQKLIKNGDLKTYQVLFYNKGTVVRSNIKHVITREDFLDFLRNATKRSYARNSTFSGHILGQPIDPEDEIQDLFKRKKVKANDEEVFYIIQSLNDDEEQEKVLERIVDREVVLHSQASLAELLKKGRTSIFRTMKALPSIHFVLGGTAESTRLVLEPGVMGEQKYPLQLLYYVSSFVVDLCEIKFNKPIPFKPYSSIEETPYDYMWLYLDANYNDDPDFITVHNDKVYLCVDAAKAKDYSGPYILRNVVDKKGKIIPDEMIQYFCPR